MAKSKWQTDSNLKSAPCHLPFQIASFCSLFPIPCSLFPVPYSLFPVPYSLFPIPHSLLPVILVAASGPGEVSEWLKEHAWKACSREIVTWVRIPPSPPA